MKTYLLLLAVISLAFAGCNKKESTTPTTTTETNAVPSTNAPAP